MLDLDTRHKTIMLKVIILRNFIFIVCDIIYITGSVSLPRLFVVGKNVCYHQNFL